jgi:hypothetical protein
MTDKKLKFVKSYFANVAAAQGASTGADGIGKIIFDKSHKVICVDGDVYGGNIQDVSYNATTNKLTIIKADGSEPTVLDFSDVASASSTMAVFGQLRDAIGVTNAAQAVQGHYANTAYLQGAQSLIMADIALDNQIKAVQGALVDVAFTGDFEDVIIPAGKEIEYEGVTLEVQGTDGFEPAGNLREALQAMLQGVVDNENVTEAAFEAVQGAIGLNDDLTFPTHDNANFIDEATSVDEALVALDNAVQGVAKAISDITIPEYSVQEVATETGYLKSYQLTKGGNAVGAKINIPKDFLVKSASVATVETADTPYTGAVVGDKYIDFVINVKSGSATNEHLYLPVNDLVDVYTAQQNATQVQLAIDSNNEISATIVNGAVTSEKIAAQGVETSNIKDGAVTAAKLGNDVVSLPQDPTVKVNDDTAQTGTTVATVAGQDIKVKAELFWDTWDDTPNQSQG